MPLFPRAEEDTMSGNARGHPDGHRDDMNAASLLRLGLFGSIAFLIASTLPHDLMAASLSSLLWIGAMISAMLAAFVGESLTAPHLTRWDEAAVLVLLSILLGWFVDPQAMMSHVQAMRS
ncbi:hypothetical protein SAMN05421720_103137 [Rhodospira trueperi]|uniref:Uncharacterized protein n=2 Tax=Rhodospira trueperi TaxID=69960 RepID=A0A1G7A1W2_9PROT|nr:hypothetical protein SAMN05421720_103137 [Rhodospira trueperi]